MAKANKSYSFPTPSNPGTIGPLAGYTPQGCAICHVNPAGPSGMCANCASGLVGPPGIANQCAACGKAHTARGTICPTCLFMQMRAVAAFGAGQAFTATITKPLPEPLPEPLPRADMQVVDLIGWRVWRITALGYLKSLTADRIWLPGEAMEAPSVVDAHGQINAPGMTAAMLGIHVFASKTGAINEVENYVIAAKGNYAIGTVLLWGDVVEHERGYRAERAKITSIDEVAWAGKAPWDKETAEVLSFLRGRYGVGDVPHER